MDRIVSSSHDRTSLLSTHKVLRNTYFMLSLTLAFSAITATASTVLMLPSPGLILTTRKDMSFLGGMLMAGIVVVLIGMVANIFLQLPALHLAISAVFILISSGAILFETSNIIHGGETNYIRATVSLYVSLYNIFVSLLSILGFASRD